MEHKITERNLFAEVATGVCMAIVFMCIVEYVLRKPKEIPPDAVKAGHAHYDERTGELVWNSGNCR